MKRKSLFVRGDTLIKWHAVIYIVFTVALWWSVIATTTYPGNETVPFTVNGDFIMSRIGVTIFWGLFFLLHFAFHQLRSWSQGRARRSHLKMVSAMQERYVSGVRLDVDAQAKDGVLIDEDNWRTQQRLQSK